jgi:hypothetical protein
VLGLSLAHGLNIYEQRNDGLYDHVITRARRIEAELGVETGLMLGRPAKPHKRVSHGRATRWVFGSVKGAWIVVAVVLLASVIGNLHSGDPLITLEEYDLVTVGQTRTRVADLLDGLGEVEFRAVSNDGLIEVVGYRGAAGGEAVVTFLNGSVIDKGQFGLAASPD